MVYGIVLNSMISFEESEQSYEIKKETLGGSLVIPSTASNNPLNLFQPKSRIRTSSKGCSKERFSRELSFMYIRPKEITVTRPLERLHLTSSHLQQSLFVSLVQVGKTKLDSPSLAGPSFLSEYNFCIHVSAPTISSPKSGFDP